MNNNDENKDEEYKSMKPNNKAKIWLYTILSIIALILLWGSFYIVNPGERAFIVTLGNPSDTVYSSGIHFKLPIVQDAIIMNVQTQKFEASASAASNDLQIVSANITVNYAIDPSQVVQIYKTIGLDYQDIIIAPAVQEVVKATTAKYTAEELITQRAKVKEDIELNLKNTLANRGILVQSVLITDFDFSDTFNQAIEAKVVAQQNALAAKNKLEQVQFEAQQRITQSTAEAQAIQIQAQAITAQGGKEYVDLQAIQKWDGKLPQYMGSGIIPFVGNNLNLNTSK